MNVHTGQIVEISDPSTPMGPDWVPVNRSLKAKEQAAMQIKLYSLCGCGSGKKFKFCCKSKPKTP